MQKMLNDDLMDSFKVLVRFPTYNTPVKALAEEFDRLLATHPSSAVGQAEQQLAALITRIQEQHALSQQHIITMDLIGPSLSQLIETAKLELIDKQNTLGPQLSYEVERVHQNLLLSSAVIVIFLLSLVWWSRRAIFNPLNKSLKRLRQNQQQLDSTTPACVTTYILMMMMLLLLKSLYNKLTIQKLDHIAYHG